MPALVGRIFREFAITIIVTIFASGIVSLTLTPMMCSRMLSNRGHGYKKTLMERFGAVVIDRILMVYGRSLSWFLKYRFISLLLWMITLVGTVYLFNKVPRSFLPVGDSGLAFGVMIGQQGASPQQMQHFQAQADAMMRANPAVQASFSMTGNSQFLVS